MNDSQIFGIAVISMLGGMIITAVLTWASDKLYDCPNKLVRIVARFVYELMDEIQWIVMFITAIFIALILGATIIYKK